MAQRAEALTLAETYGRLAPVVPLGIETLSCGRSDPGKGFRLRYYCGAKTRAVRSLSMVVDKTTSLFENVRGRVEGRAR
jgi:hypothetical protein